MNTLPWGSVGPEYDVALSGGAVGKLSYHCPALGPAVHRVERRVGVGVGRNGTLKRTRREARIGAISFNWETDERTPDAPVLTTSLPATPLSSTKE